MQDLIKIIIIIFIITSKVYASDTKKILFSINENVYTSIDLDNRTKYLEFLTNNSINMLSLIHI